MSIHARLGVLAFALTLSIGCREPAPAPSMPVAPVASAPAPLASALTTAPSLPAPAPGPEVPLVAPSPALFARDQPWIGGIRAWDGALAAVGQPHADGTSYRIELADQPERARAVPLVVPGAERVLDVAAYGETPVALVKTSGGLVLALHRGSSWSIEPVPEPARARDDVILAASHDAVALLHEGQLHIYRAGSWKSTPIDALREDAAVAGRGARHVLLRPDRLVLGFAAGEWGGALVSLDLATGAWTRYPVKDPVTDLVAGPDGAAWATTGLAHLGGVMGAVSRLDTAGWKMVTKVEGSRAVTGKQNVTVHLGWDLPLASFDAAAFDEQGRIHVLTRQLGVVRRDGERWTQLTPAWPELVVATGLAVRGALLVIATFDAGVVLWDVSTGKARRVALSP